MDASRPGRDVRVVWITGSPGYSTLPLLLLVLLVPAVVLALVASRMQSARLSVRRYVRGSWETPSDDVTAGAGTSGRADWGFPRSTPQI